MADSFHIPFNFGESSLLLVQEEAATFISVEDPSLSSFTLLLAVTYHLRTLLAL
jgi:hypothetical protein